ncbi:hypothetical protein FNV43_RR13243 [Rhamnella rubrinervis]|uniref:GDSL esterase/lipase n=1 Tax=Rhamnella rubrinervis TaxID=2594499 RepID=A0A8K0MEX4_9ROSA|nr:hypothetical protein FNV43_RR13243 [Rhamnella rubrinervis]
MAYLHISWLCLIQTVLVVLVDKSEAKISAVVVFGDSSVDSGNNNFIPTIARGNFEPYGRDFQGGQPTGRFSNGRIPPDFISEAVGLKPTIPAYLDPTYSISDFASGVCFASAGTGYDNATSDVLGVIPLWKEVEYFKEYQNKLKAYVGDEKAKEILRPVRFRSSKDVPDRVPPMGCLPLERTTNILEGHACVEGYNNVALEFNGKLKDAYDLLLEMITKPSLYGKIYGMLALQGSATGDDFTFGFLLLYLFIYEHFDSLFPSLDSDGKSGMLWYREIRDEFSMRSQKSIYMS